VGVCIVRVVGQAYALPERIQMKNDITIKANSLNYIDLLCIRNLLLAHSFDAGATGDKGIEKISLNLSNKVTRLIAEMEA